MGIFGGLKLLLVVGLLAGAGGGLFYVKNLKANLDLAKANVAKLESAVETSEASLALLKKDNARLNDLADQLNIDLKKSEEYGDELRATLNKHNVFGPTIPSATSPFELCQCLTILAVPGPNIPSAGEISSFSCTSATNGPLEPCLIV